MLHLLLAIAASAALALVLKLGEARARDRYAVTAINYVAACLGALIMAGDAPWPWPLPPGALDAIGAAWSTGGPVDPAFGPAWAGLWGLVTGGLLFAGLVSFQVAIHRHGVGLAAAMAKLGILVPVILSLGLFGESPAPVQWAGIALALSAVAIVNWPERRTHWRDAIRPALVLALVCVGLSEFSGKVFQQFAAGHKPIFLAVAFGMAGVIAWIVVAARRRRFGWAEVLLGVGVGVPNLFSIGSLVDALDALPAAVVFPVFSAGSLLVVQVAGVLLFGEALDRRARGAVAATLVALVLINL